MSQFNFIELCAGAGGLSSGLIKAGLNPILLNDFDKDCCETLKLNHPNVNIVCESMENIDFSQYIDIDVLVGGVPCQSFSIAGKRNGLDDPRGNLIVKFIEIIKIVRPKLFMIENVKGLLSHNNGKTIKEILISLNEIYDIKYKVLNAFDYEVPQKRERLIIVGTNIILNKSFRFPDKKENKVLLKDVMYNVPLSIIAKYSDEKIDLFKLIPQGGCWINLPKELQQKYLGKSYNSIGGKRGILYRLSMDKPSPTLLCSPTQKQTERCHPLEERPLSVREYARIQTFDDSYDFIGSMTSQYKQIGNAVPVNLAYSLGLAIINYLN